MTFRKRTARGKTLLQKGFPPGPPFRKLLNGYGVAMCLRQDRLPAHDLKKHIYEFFAGEGPEDGFLATPFTRYGLIMKKTSGPCW